MDKDYLRDAGTVRKYILQTFKELRHGFTNEVDLPTFYDNVDSIDVLFENDLVSGKVGKWIPFIERLKSEVGEYKNTNASIDFLIEYLFTHLGFIEERINHDSPINKVQRKQRTQIEPSFDLYFRDRLDSTKQKEIIRKMQKLCTQKKSDELAEYVIEMQNMRDLNPFNSKLNPEKGLYTLLMGEFDNNFYTNVNKKIKLIKSLSNG